VRCGLEHSACGVRSFSLPRHEHCCFALLLCGMVAAKRKGNASKESARAEISGRWVAPSTGDSKRTARGGQSVTPHGRFLYIVGGRYLLKGCVERGTVAIGWDPCR
jgi:hypothetical protein